MTDPARVIALEGALNFRDFGGWPTTTGSQVRSGVLFRSAALHRLTETDLRTLADLGIRTVYDLRDEHERLRSPSVLPEDVLREALPIGGAAANTREMGEQFFGGAVSELPADFLERIYDGIVESAAPAYGTLLNLIADQGGAPVLIHCTAGKDRTGIAVALILSVLGVEESDILDDYELSATHYTEMQIERQLGMFRTTGVSQDQFRALFGAPRSAMATALAGLRSRYGSVEDYLVAEGGVDRALFDTLRTCLLETP